jgi:hypothetical protein
MAFHPFRYFRKHQKAFFAVMLMVCMVTFVFTGFAGRGADPFYRILNWMGAGRHQGEVVLSLFGKKIYEDDVDRIRKNRQLANEFLLYGILSRNFLFSSIADIRKKYDKLRGGENDAATVKAALVSWDSLNSQNSMGMPPSQRYGMIQFHLQSVAHTAAQDTALQNDPEQLAAVDTIVTALSIEAWAVDMGLKQQREYFLGGRQNSVDDYLDFAVWLHQADKLGISLTSADVIREVNRVWGNRDRIQPEGKFDGNPYVAEFLSTSNKVHKSLGAPELLSALTDEFRVALAKEAVLGQGPGYRFYRGEFDGIHNSPAVATPDEFFRYFQKQRRTLAVKILPLAVEDFVKDVKVEPTEADLHNLYETYKNREPAPFNREPGFKEPRRIKVQYFSYSPDSPAYKKLAAKATELLPLFRLGIPANNYAAGGGLAWALRLATTPMGMDVAIQDQYLKYREEESNRIGTDHFGVGFNLDDRKAAQVQAPAATLGQLVGTMGTGGTPLSVPVSYLGTTEIYQTATLKAFASAVLAGGSSSTWAALSQPLAFVHTVQPFEAVKDKMRERDQKALARKLVDSNFGMEGLLKFGILGTVEEEMKKLAKKADKKEFETYLEKLRKDNGVENFHSMSKAQTRQEILDNPDPVLKELKEAYEKATSFFPQNRPDFVTALFQTEPRLNAPLFSPESQFKLTDKDESFLFWRSEDVAAHVRSYKEVAADVEKAWKFEKARKLARQDADRIVAAIVEKNYNAADAEKFLRDRNHGFRLFELTNVAHLVPRSRDILIGRETAKLTPSDFRPYQVPKDRIAYPTTDFLDRLSKLDKPGDALVLSDQPANHFYVAVLMEKPQLPDRREFYEIYSQTGANDPIWGEMMKSRRREYQKKVIEQLRAEATKELEGGEYVIPESVRTRFESSNFDSGE